MEMSTDTNIIILKKFRNGGSLSEYTIVNRNATDYKQLKTVGRLFAQNGHSVTILPTVHYKDILYKEIFGSLIGTIYERKCPDLLIDGLFYEYESYSKPWKIRKISKMISHGSEQSNRLIINNTKGCTYRYIINNIIRRLHDKSFKLDIKEVWVYEKGSIVRIWA